MGNPPGMRPKVQNRDGVAEDGQFKKSRFYRSQKLFMTLSLVAMALKMGQTRQNQSAVFMISTIRRKVLCGTVRCCLRKEKGTIVQSVRGNTVVYNVGYLKSFNV